MNKIELKQLIKEVIVEQNQASANVANSVVDKWLDILETTKVSYIGISPDNKTITFKLIDGGVAVLESASPIILKPIVHTN